MRGGFLHNHALIGRLARSAGELGYRTRTEVHIASDSAQGFIDLIISDPRTNPKYVIAVEAELTPRRIDRDVKKAILIGASELWLLVPSPRVGRAVRRRLGRPEAGHRPGICVLLLSQAIAALAERKELFSLSNASGEINAELAPASGEAPCN